MNKINKNPTISAEIGGFLACHYEITISAKRCGASDLDVAPNCLNRFKDKLADHRITPQAIFVLELPDGWVLKLSGQSWMMAVFAIIS